MTIQHKTIFMPLLFALVLLGMAITPQTIAAPKIAWFSTLQEDLSEKSGFWLRVHDLIRAAGEDLDADVQIYYAEENFIKMNAQAERILSDPQTRPDGIIFHNYKRVGEKILLKAESYGVKSLIFNSGMPKDSEALTPRTKYKHWIGEILPDDEKAGAELLLQLKLAARRLSPDSLTQPPLSVLAMEGNLSSSAYLSRRAGMQSVLANSKDYQFLQFVPADWSRKIASSQFNTIYARYPDVKILWAGNDNMALGLIDGAQNAAKRPGVDFVVGGIDWLPEALEAIRAETMAVSVGGHFVEGMWALILMYDYLNGIDFQPKYGISLRTRMFAITKQVLDQYGDLDAKLAPKNLSKMDYRTLTKTHNPALNDYPFDVSLLLGRL